MTDLLETLHQMLQNGLSWATLVTVLLYISKMRESRIRRQERSEMRQDIKAIKEKLGVEEWPSNGQVNGSLCTEVQRLKKQYSLLRKAINRAKAPRRIKRMNFQRINWYTFIPALVAALKLIFQTLNIPFIADAQANELANGAAALLTIIGVALSHRKDGVSNASATPTSIGPSK